MLVGINTMHAQRTFDSTVLEDSYMPLEEKVYKTSAEAEGQNVKKPISRSRRYIKKKKMLEGKFSSFWLNLVRCHSPDESSFRK